MPAVVPVKFAYSARDLWFNPSTVDPREGDHVICETARGLEIGLVTQDPFEVPVEELGDTVEDRTLKDVVRLASEEDLNRAEELAEAGDAAMETFRRLVKNSELDMKPVGVEYLFDGEKVVCYFAAEERVDFRQLVRDISSELNERVDMRQIGVREESALIGGYAHCGQELCCARFGQQFEPVSIRMAKEQDLPLNSSKISGVCGRLMCCLRYEFEAYRDFKNRAPKKNAVIQTPLGTAKIVEYDTPKEMLTLRLESGKTLRVPLADMTSSDEAIKKAEELGCACRPDTVERSVLERLDSPEVQMALAELDRENGLVEEEEFATDDIFVEEPKRKRRRSHRADGQVESAEQASNAKSTGAGGDGRADQEAEQQNSRSRRATRTRRNRKQGVAQEQQATQDTQNSQRTRGNRSAARTRNERTQEASQPAQAMRRRRRPGDRGGVQAQSPEREQAAPTNGTTRTRRRTHNASQGESGANDSNNGTTRTRRRHHTSE